MNKTRPCLIISSDITNQSDLVVVVAPITSNIERLFPKIEVKIILDGRPSKVVPRQMRSIDRIKRLGKKIGKISPDEMKIVDDALKLILSL